MDDCPLVSGSKVVFAGARRGLEYRNVGLGCGAMRERGPSSVAVAKIRAVSTDHLLRRTKNGQRGDIAGGPPHPRNARHYLLEFGKNQIVSARPPVHFHGMVARKPHSLGERSSDISSPARGEQRRGAKRLV